MSNSINLLSGLRKQAANMELPKEGTIIIPIEGIDHAYLAQVYDGKLIGTVVIGKTIVGDLSKMMQDWAFGKGWDNDE